MAINYAALGKRLQKARKLKDMSSSDLAQRVRLTPKSIVFLEEGQADITLDLLLSLCNALDVTPNDLLAGEFFASDGRSLAERATLEELKELVLSLKEPAGSDPAPPQNAQTKSGTVVKNTQATLEEIKALVSEYKTNNANRAKAGARKNAIHW